MYRPPFTISSKAINLIAQISAQLERYAIKLEQIDSLRLRKVNRIKTIYSSLAIEGNTLSEGEVLAIIDGKRVIAPQKEIQEVKNAIKTYELYPILNPYSVKDLLKAHQTLMAGLVDAAGEFRKKGVGVFEGEKAIHIAPPANRIEDLISDLFNWLEHSEDHLLIRSCVFHYEFEFIHPFIDGNGRMGRLWQTMILKNYSKVFEFLPIETLVKERQQDYYNVLGKSDNQGSSTSFIEFMLEIIHAALDDLLKTQNLTLTDSDRINVFRDLIGDKEFSRLDYLRNNKDLSSATASRDLKNAVDNGVLIKTGDKRLTRYRFK